MEEIIEEEGPFDGVIGFSQGAAVAANILLLYQAKNLFGPPPFKVAVFLCATSLYGAPERKEYEAYIQGLSKNPFQLPTVHVVGKLDPDLQFSLDMMRLCDKRLMRTVEHAKGHEISRDLAVNEATRAAIEWAVTLSQIDY